MLVALWDKMAIPGNICIEDFKTFSVLILKREHNYQLKEDCYKSITSTVYNISYVMDLYSAIKYT